MVAIYIMQCADNTFYTGITANVKRRTSQHKLGQCRYTRKHVFKEIVYIDYAPDYVQARIIEKYIKKMGAKKFLYSKGVFL